MQQRELINLNPRVKNALDGLLQNKNNPEQYQKNMIVLGELSAEQFVSKFSDKNQILTISTAEDTDFLLSGVRKILDENSLNTKLAVFWNHHYALETGGSVAPVVHQYIESGYENSDIIIIVKSVISGSCVVRTNLIAMLDQVKQAKEIYVVSPVMYVKAENNLKAEFPPDISAKFKFITFAIDTERSDDGEVIPGIGGQIYSLLGLEDQPVKTGYIPQIIQQRIFGSD